MSGTPDPPMPAGKKRVLDLLKAKLAKAVEKQGKATTELADLEKNTKSTKTQKEAARKALEDANKEFEAITKSINEAEKSKSKDAPERINNFGSNIGTLFENAKPMVGPYPKPKDENTDLRLPFGLESLLKRKFPCDETTSKSGIKTAQEIIGDGVRVSEIQPDVICTLGQEPDKCKTDAGVILSSQCPAHRIVISKSLEGLGESIRRDIEEVKAESLKKMNDLHTSLVPKLKGGPTKRPNPPQTPKFDSNIKSNPNIKRFNTQPDDWNLDRDPTLLEFRFDASKNNYYAEYYDNFYWYRIYGNKPEDIVKLYSKHFEGSNDLYLIFQFDTDLKRLYAVKPDDKTTLIYGESPEDIVSRFNKMMGLEPEPGPEPPGPPPLAFFSRSNSTPFINYITYLIKEISNLSKDGYNYAVKNSSTREIISRTIKKDPELIKKFTEIHNKIKFLSDVFDGIDDIDQTRSDPIDQRFISARDSIKDLEFDANSILQEGTSKIASFKKNIDESKFNIERLIAAIYATKSGLPPEPTPTTPTPTPTSKEFLYDQILQKYKNIVCRIEKLINKGNDYVGNENNMIELSNLVEEYITKLDDNDITNNNIKTRITEILEKIIKPVAIIIKNYYFKHILMSGSNRPNDNEKILEFKRAMNDILTNFGTDNEKKALIETVIGPFCKKMM